MALYDQDPTEVPMALYDQDEPPRALYDQDEPPMKMDDDAYVTGGMYSLLNNLFTDLIRYLHSFGTTFCQVLVLLHKVICVCHKQPILKS